MTDEQMKDFETADFDDDGEGGENEGLWPGDRGLLELNSRRALLQLVRGPLISADTGKDLWQALLNDRLAIASRLADLFLVLVIKEEDGIAFVQNAPSADPRVPKTVRAQPLTLIDTILVLMLRRELVGSGGRVIIGREETYATLANYRPVSQLDEAAYRRRLDNSWNKLVNNGMLMGTDIAERFEISPVLKLVFSAEDAEAVSAAFDELLADAGETAIEPPQDEERQ